MTPPLATSDLAVGYRHRRLLDGLDLVLEAGRLTCLLGPNGCGKSTLLRTLAGIQPALSGRVLLDGHDVNRLEALERARRLAVVLTDPVDVGLMRAGDLVALGRYPHTGWDGRLSAADHAAIRWALAVTRTQPLAHRHVAELSDGERQRVLVARALAQEPAVLALDEPTAFVDVPHRVELLALLRRLSRENSLAVLLSTHDLELAVRSADLVWLVEHSRIRVGAPEDLVLDGSLGAAFRGDGVVFDPLRGPFTPAQLATGTVAVRGDTGAATHWTRRALEREGLALTDGLADLVVHVEPGPMWRVSDSHRERVHASIASLVEDVRAAFSDRARRRPPQASPASPSAPDPAAAAGPPGRT
jgi:iron complex transport system ATP-binding protein